jgi:hypothetical protein
MARETILSKDTILYSTSEPEGRTFPAGEQWPGDAWIYTKGGPAPASKPDVAAMKALVAASDENERLMAVIASAEHDRGKLSDELAAERAKASGLTQRATEAEAASAQAKALHLATAAERDQAQQAASTLRGALETANATVVAQDDEIKALKAQIGRFDGDKDGHTGGSAKRAGKDAPEAGSKT